MKRMPGKNIVATLRAKLDATFARIGSFSGRDLELHSDFARYLCILVSGFVETALSELTAEHCRKRAAPTVSNYAQSQLSRLQNVKSERLLQLMGSFDPKMRVEFEEFIDGPRKDALDSVVDLRNKIAHGESVGVTYMRIKDYYKLISEIIDFVEAKLS